MWLDDIRGGLGVARRRWLGVVSLAGIVAVAGLVLSLALGDVLSQLSLLRQGAALRERGAVAFSTYYIPGRVAPISAAIVSDLETKINQSKAYTAVLRNVGVDDEVPTHEPGRVVLFFGDALHEVFPELQLSPAPSMMRGSKVPAEVPDVYSIAGYSLSAAGRIPAGAIFFDANALGVPLDDRILITLPPSALARLSPYELEEAVGRTVFLDPTDASLDAFVRDNARVGWYLVPQRAIDQPAMFRDAMVMSSVYITGMLSFLALTLMAFAASMKVIVAQEARGFTIRHMYGAGRSALALRIGAFLAACLLVLPGLTMLPLAIIATPWAIGARLVLPALLLLFIVAWVAAYRSALSASRIGECR